MIKSNTIFDGQTGDTLGMTDDAKAAIMTI